jgi:hypothetical protein
LAARGYHQHNQATCILEQAIPIQKRDLNWIAAGDGLHWEQRPLDRNIMSDPEQPKTKATTLPGLAAIGLLITGVAGIHHAYDTGSGVGLIASAISFGCIFIAMFL